MTVVTQFPCPVREVENLWIPLADGTRLAARMWLPDDAEAHPVPAVLEYIPYRKRDWTSARDEAMHPYFAGHGYAAIRVDIRGSGESEGILLDEYLMQEQDDALEVIAWLASQPWCSGAVGMMGKSWGGFNVLQVAARQPPALEAIISVYSTVDRYADDIHTMGGCQLASNLGWSSVMFEYNSRPPDPALVGERWRAMWLERLEHSSPWILEWLEHQHRDAFWKHGSVIENYDAVRCPVYAVGGWADGYTNAVPNLLAGLSVPRKGIVGPWGHQYPHQAYPQPRYGFLQDATRWWDHWLKGKDTGIMDEPMYRAWMQESVPPAPMYETRPGRWVTETAWPSPNVEMRRNCLNARGLGEAPGDGEELYVCSPQSTGETALRWSATGDLVPDLPSDQRPDDARSLTFDSEPLSERLEILGTPVARLMVSADKPNALVAVRLCDVAPNGESTRVTSGLLNLTHRDSHEHPRALIPGRWYTVQVRLKHMAYAFSAGHTIRVAVQTAFWPVTWPSPEAATVTMKTGESEIDLPVRAPRTEDAHLPELPPAESAPLDPRTVIEGSRDRPPEVDRDMASGRVTVRTFHDGGLVCLDRHGLVYGDATQAVHRVRDDDPATARAEHWFTARMWRDGWRVRTETHTVMTCDRESFHIEADLTAYEGEDPVFERSWKKTIPRRLV